MFGLIVSGRLVQTEVERVSETQFLFNIPDADNINHVVVFMTGQTPFPDGFGGAVYFSWPSAEGQSWQLLGFLSNMKPSVIFKISKLKDSVGDGSSHPFGALPQQPSHLAQIGISVEPLEALSQQTPNTFSNTSTAEPFVEFTNKMLENYVNFVSSFAVTQAQMQPNPNENFVPLSTVQKWYEIFKRRLQQNLYFWRS